MWQEQVGAPAARRRVWHPLTLAFVLALGAAVAAFLQATGTAGAPVALWLSMGALAGFATSGST